MRRRHRWTSLWVVVLAAAGLTAVPAGPASAGGPIAWTWPGDCSTATTFQECVDLASSGDSITIETDGPITGGITLSKTLTIEAAPGWSPVFTGSAFVFTDLGTILVLLDGLTFEGHIEVSLTGGTGHSVELVDVRSTGDDFYSAFRASAHVPASVTVTGGRFTVGGKAEGVEFAASHPTGSTWMALTGSRISGHGQAGTGGGITVDVTGAGATELDLKNNVVWDVNLAPAGGSSGIHLYPSGPAMLDADVIGNTVVRARTNAFYVRNDVTTGAVSLNVFDNILARSLRGVYLESSDPSTLTVRAGYNGFHRNQDENIWEEASPGPGNLEAHPGFVDLTNGNLRLLADSPFVDAGKVCVPGGPAMTEAGGLARLAGDTVDIGAHERRADLPTGIAQIGGGGSDLVPGTDGADILCGFGGDELYGYEGDDYLDGGSGQDVIFASAGVDHLYGGKGDDPCLLSFDDPRSADLVDGGPGTDGAIFDRLDVLRRVEVDGVCS
jgi:hypothetical protein